MVIPIHPVVKIILEKYGNKPPVIQCNQATNRMLKKICRKAGITEKINIMETKGGIRQEVTYEKSVLADGTEIFDIITSGIKQRCSFTEI